VIRRAFADEDSGFYVDVGAADPVIHSTTKAFYDRGWTGINVEPAVRPFERLQAARKRDVNLNVAVASHAGEVEFYEFPEPFGGNSTIIDEVAADFASVAGQPIRRKVPAITLNQLFEEYVGERSVDFLKLDIEGSEAEALAGFDMERFRPRLLVIEASVPNRPEPSHGAWEPLVLAHRYRLALFDGLNRFYVSEESDVDFEKLTVPANVFDDFVPYELVQCEEQHRADLEELHRQVAERLAAVEELSRQLADTRAALEQAQAQAAALASEVEARETELGAARKTIKQLAARVEELSLKAAELRRALCG